MNKHPLLTRFLVASVLLFSLLVAPISSVNVRAQEGSGSTTVDDTSAGGDENPEAQPTTEPTVEPASQPTTEPTAEPTSEPTAEPTAEPTSEPTAEPTTEPTVEPTAEPTEEPTAEPTEEPTVEPTAEPTEEPTAEPTEEPTVEPTAEPTETAPVIESESAGEIGTAAITGKWTSEVIAIQNLSETDPATVGFELYPQSANGTPITGSPPAPVLLTVNGGNPIPANGSTTVSVNSLSNGAYAGVLSSNTPVAVAAFQRNAQGQVGDVHVGFDSSALAQELIVARIFKNHFGYSTKIYVQNAHTAAQDITFEAFVVGATSPTVSKTYTNVAQNTSFTIDIKDFNQYPSGNNVSLGYARVRGSAGNVAVIGDSVRDTGVAWQSVEVSLPGIPESVAAVKGEKLIIPRVFNVYFTWDTGVPVVNLSNVQTDVKLTYTDQNNKSYSKTLKAGPNAGLSFFLPTDFPNALGTFGGVEIECLAAGCKIIAVSNNVYKGDPSKPSGAGNAPALNSKLATNKAAVPLAFRQGKGFDFNQWTTGVVVYNLEPGNVTTRWTKANSNPSGSNVKTWTQNNQKAGTVTTFFAPDNTALDNFGTGSVFIESTGKIMVGATYNFGNTRGNAPATQY